MSINATLIGQMITFTLLVWFTMKYVWPPIIAAMEERKAKIADGLAAAEKGQDEIKLAEKKAKGLLKEAKEQSVEIISSAQKRANEFWKPQERKSNRNLCRPEKVCVKKFLPWRCVLLNRF